MRWYIIRTLLLNESLRHLADRGGIFLALLLVGAALLLSLFGKEEAQGGPFIGSVRKCYVDYWEEGPWIDHLLRHPPVADLKIRFRHASQLPTDSRGVIVYEQSTGAIQVRVEGTDDAGRPRYRVMLWYPGSDPAVMAPYVDWFWKETLHYFHGQNVPVEMESNAAQVVNPGTAAVIYVRPADSGAGGRARQKLLYRQPQPGEPFPNESDESSRGRTRKPVEIEVQNEELHGRADLRSMVMTGFVIFPLVFFSVYLLPALTCEERERGILLAQMLSPATTQEIMAAKFIFYASVGTGLGALLAGIYNVAVLGRPFFWLCLLATAAGEMAVGMTIASIARTQRKASLGALCYMLTVALLIFITERFGIPSFQYLALEYYCPRIMHAALEGEVANYHRANLVAAIVLALGWGTLATYLFRKRGWQ